MELKNCLRKKKRNKKETQKDNSGSKRIVKEKVGWGKVVVFHFTNLSTEKKRRVLQTHPK
jgi:hypothetical protein